MHWTQGHIPQKHQRWMLQAQASQQWSNGSKSCKRSAAPYKMLVPALCICPRHQQWLSVKLVFSHVATMLTESSANAAFQGVMYSYIVTPGLLKPPPTQLRTCTKRMGWAMVHAQPLSPISVRHARMPAGGRRHAETSGHIPQACGGLWGASVQAPGGGPAPTRGREWSG